MLEITTVKFTSAKATCLKILIHDPVPHTLYTHVFLQITDIKKPPKLSQFPFWPPKQPGSYAVYLNKMSMFKIFQDMLKWYIGLQLFILLKAYLVFTPLISEQDFAKI